MPRPELLMRARYAAYVLGLVDYVIDTTDPSGPQARADRASWRREVERFSQQTSFDGLEIVEAEPASDAAPEGWVTFRAQLTRDGADVSFTERSRFTRVADRWLYYGGERP